MFLSGFDLTVVAFVFFFIIDLSDRVKFCLVFRLNFDIEMIERRLYVFPLSVCILVPLAYFLS
jgi:hypothetical protein